MNMKPVLLACALLASGAGAAAAPANAGVEARQAPSCGEWIVHREKSDTLALANASWLLGYLSGIATAGKRDFLHGNENSAIYKWMDAYCRANPLRNVSSGGAALAIELAAKTGPAR
jgi:hypothetical protein